MLKKIKETELLRTPVFTVVEKEFEGTDFKPVGLNCNDWVMVMIKDSVKNEWLFVKQTRWGEETQTVELPCGTVENHEVETFGIENARKYAAIREVEEETGLNIADSSIELLKVFNPNPAYFNNRMSIFYVEVPNLKEVFNKHKNELHLDPDEDCQPFIGGLNDFARLEEHSLGMNAKYAYCQKKGVLV